MSSASAGLYFAFIAVFTVVFTVFAKCAHDGIIDPRRVATKDNTSDVFTKTLGADDINRLRPGLTGYGPLPPIPESMPT